MEDGTNGFSLKGFSFICLTFHHFNIPFFQAGGREQVLLTGIGCCYSKAMSGGVYDNRGQRYQHPL